MGVSPDNHEERPVPSEWRSSLFEIVEAIRQGNSTLEGVFGVRPISPLDANRISRNIEVYGTHLCSLSDMTWRTSVSRWMDEHWDVLVDLFTVEEGESDFALYVRVYEVGGSYEFEVESVHVP